MLLAVLKLSYQMVVKVAIIVLSLHVSKVLKSFYGFFLIGLKDFAWTYNICCINLMWTPYYFAMSQYSYSKPRTHKEPKDSNLFVTKDSLYSIEVLIKLGLIFPSSSLFTHRNPVKTIPFWDHPVSIPVFR